MKTLIKNGYLIDPYSDTEGIRDILLEDAYILDIKESIEAPQAVQIDASGMAVMPGFVDLHAHLREPGFEYKETIETGTAAAAAGGYTTICAMPNTKPVTDSIDTLETIKDKIKMHSHIHCLPIGAVTVNQQGEVIADIAGMAEHGICAISEDGKSVLNTAIYYKAMQIAKEAGIPVFAHCEDKILAGNGVLSPNAAKRLGMEPIANAVEDIITARDIILARETGVRLHLCHCSTAGSVELIRMAKKEGIPVTAEVCPHHFSLSEDDIITDDANYKMNPPLRSKADVIAVTKALREGIIDVIATDHAPHSENEKKQSIRTAPFGITGLETAFSLGLTVLVNEGKLSLLELVKKMSLRPAEILCGGREKINFGALFPGMKADIVIADLLSEHIINSESFVSKGHNTPFNGKKVNGAVMITIADGKIIYKRQKKEMEGL